MGVERVGERDRILHRHLGAGSDAEVGGVHRVAEEDDVVGVPARRAASAEVAPARVVREQRAALQLLGEELGDVGAGLLVGRPGGQRDVELVQAGRAPGGLVGLDDEGAHVGRDRVGVHGEVAVLIATVQEGETVEHAIGAEPDELGGGLLDRMAEPLIADRGAEGRVGAVACHDHIVVAELRRVGHELAEAHVDASGGGLLLQQAEQGAAVDRGHAVAAEGARLALRDDVDGLPALAVLREPIREYRVGGLDLAQRGVGEHDAEAEGVIRLVALEERDLPLGAALLHERREEQTTGAAAYDSNSFRH